MVRAAKTTSLNIKLQVVVSTHLQNIKMKDENFKQDWNHPKKHSVFWASGSNNGTYMSINPSWTPGDTPMSPPNFGGETHQNSRFGRSVGGVVSVAAVTWSLKLGARTREHLPTAHFPKIHPGHPASSKNKPRGLVNLNGNRIWYDGS